MFCTPAQHPTFSHFVSGLLAQNPVWCWHSLNACRGSNVGFPTCANRGSCYKDATYACTRRSWISPCVISVKLKWYQVAQVVWLDPRPGFWSCFTPYFLFPVISLPHKTTHTPMAYETFHKLPDRQQYLLSNKLDQKCCDLFVLWATGIALTQIFSIRAWFWYNKT